MLCYVVMLWRCMHYRRILDNFPPSLDWGRKKIQPEVMPHLLICYLDCWCDSHDICPLLRRPLSSNVLAGYRLDTASKFFHTDSAMELRYNLIEDWSHCMACLGQKSERACTFQTRKHLHTLTDIIKPWDNVRKFRAQTFFYWSHTFPPKRMTSKPFVNSNIFSNRFKVLSQMRLEEVYSAQSGGQKKKESRESKSSFLILRYKDQPKATPRLTIMYKRYILIAMAPYQAGTQPWWLIPTPSRQSPLIQIAVKPITSKPCTIWPVKKFGQGQKHALKSCDLTHKSHSWTCFLSYST